jgi:electron transfer flavoprotein beta subunit
MKILVCVKEVLDPECGLRIDPSQRTLSSETAPLYRMNRFDEFAIEEALLIKDRIPGTKADAVTVGPARASAVIRRAIGMGADDGFHILEGEGATWSPFVVAAWIAAWAARGDYDLILTGTMAEDDMEGQVGQLVAAFLGWPCATSVIQITMKDGLPGLEVERELEGGLRHVMELSFPCLLTIQSGMKRPRYPSLSNVLRSRKQEIRTIHGTALGSPAPRQEIVALGYPQKSREGLFLPGGVEEKASALAEILRKRGFLR